MAVNHELQTPFKPSELDADELQLALVKHVPYAVADAAEAAALDLTGLGTLSLILGTDIFWYDSTDTTTVHDGVTCLVTTDGKRFKADGTRVDGWAGYAVDDDDLTAPPGSEAIGDKYLLPAAPTGEWAAYGKHVAIYTRRGYVFIAPRLGMLVFVDDEKAYRHYDGTAWQSGFGSYAIANGSLEPQMLEQALGWRVESELATQPGTVPTEGTLYIVGASATGADWSGEDGNVARSTGTVWQFITAVEGMTVFNKALGYNVSYKSGSWTRDTSSGLVVFRSSRVDGATGFSFTGTGVTQLLSLGARALTNSNNRICAAVNLMHIFGGATVKAGLFVDTEVTPRDEISVRTTAGYGVSLAGMLEFSPGDTSSRQYYIKVQNATSASTTVEESNAVLEEVTG